MAATAAATGVHDAQPALEEGRQRACGAERKERTEGRLKRIYGAAQTPLTRVLASPEVTPQPKLRLQQEKSQLNPFALKRQVERSLKTIAAQRRARPPENCE